MDDRELLELAAKAAEIKLFVWGKKGQENFADVSDVNKPRPWNPLTNNCDAFRLAMKLRLKITPWQDYIEVQSILPDYEKSTVNYNDDICSSARMAIVAVAAEIGRSMP